MRRTRAYRRHQRARTLARHLRDYYTLVSTAASFPPPKDIAKRHPHDCGRSRCGLCSYHKTISRNRANTERSAINREEIA